MEPSKKNKSGRKAGSTTGKPRKYMTIKCNVDVFDEFKKRVKEIRKELESQ